MTSRSTTNGKSIRHPAMTHASATPPAKAERAMQAVLALDNEATQVALARTVAGLLHDGPGTALERFAFTGELDAEAILDELDRVEVPFEEEAWVDALARYVLFTSGGRS